MAFVQSWFSNLHFNFTRVVKNWDVQKQESTMSDLTSSVTEGTRTIAHNLVDFVLIVIIVFSLSNNSM